MKTKIIVNPAARKGKSAENWPTVEERLQDHIDSFDVTFTERPGDGMIQAARAVEEGYERLVPVGGDGTVNEVINGVTDNGALKNPALVLSPIPGGTGNDMSRSLGFLDDPMAPYLALAEGKAVKVDMQRVTCEDLNGNTRQHHAALLTSVGAAAEISYKTNHSRFIKKLGAEFSYFMVAFLVTIRYQPSRYLVQIDDEPPEDMLLYSGLACNMERVGGGMRLAPGALRDDGEFDFVVFGDISRWDVLLKPPSWLIEGHHVEHPNIYIRRGRRLRITQNDSSFVDSDGESIGRLPLDIEVMPKALNFLSLAS